MLYHFNMSCLKRRDLSCIYIPHHELETVNRIMIVVSFHGLHPRPITNGMIILFKSCIQGMVRRVVILLFQGHKAECEHA